MLLLIFSWINIKNRYLIRIFQFEFLLCPLEFRFLSSARSLLFIQMNIIKNYNGWGEGGGGGEDKIDYLKKNSRWHFNFPSSSAFKRWQIFALKCTLFVFGLQKDNFLNKELSSEYNKCQSCCFFFFSNRVILLIWSQLHRLRNRTKIQDKPEGTFS